MLILATVICCLVGRNITIFLAVLYYLQYPQKSYFKVVILANKDGRRYKCCYILLFVEIYIIQNVVCTKKLSHRRLAIHGLD